MATFRKRGGKWQAIIRQKEIGTVAKTFPSKLLASTGQENKKLVRRMAILANYFQMR